VTVVVNTDDAAPSSRLEYFLDAFGRSVVPVEVRPEPDVNFGAKIISGNLGPVQVTDLTGAPGEVHRTPRLIRRCDSGTVQVYVQSGGYVLANQLGRRAHLKPGDLCLCDPSHPFHCYHSDGHTICLNFPRRLLPLGADDVKTLTAVKVPAQRGTPALASALIRSLPNHLDDVDEAEGIRLSVAVLDLITAAFTSFLDRGDVMPHDMRKRAARTQIRAFIDAHLDDPALSPTMVAHAHYMSLRSLHKLFEGAGQTIGGFIRTQRLERCRRDLLEPAYRDRPVSAIAARWGMPNPAHFSRAFRAAYGMPPAEYRVMGSGSPGSSPSRRA
jgi:AraC-like DNA-binding protein